jgi:hypothetical protein|tara:strand:+ start:112 stop:297 length:186 start_codon:yes stop_codon:yes gene_type:complete
MGKSSFLILFVLGCCLDVVADILFMQQLQGSRTIYYIGSTLTLIGGTGYIFYLIFKTSKRN